VSLILEALKKLDREKQFPDRGVVIVGPSAWPSPREGLSSLRGTGLVLAALAVGAAAGAMWLLRGPRVAEPPARAAPPSEARPTLAASIPAKPESYRPVTSAPPRAAARPKARPATAAGTDVAPGTEGAEPAPSEGAAGDTEAPEAPAVAEPPPARAAARRSGAPDFELQAISAQNGQPVAMLNDRLVHEGDTFDDVKVLRIGADEVEIEVSGHRRIVKF
jgi:hypothetical protein